MIGRLQTNKVKDVIGRAFLIHSLDRWSRRSILRKGQKRKKLWFPHCCRLMFPGEVKNRCGTRSPGFSARGPLNHLRVLGLMTMAPEVDDPEETRPVFKELRRIFDIVKESNYPRVEMRYLSMGMTQDFEVAIEEGANMVRIGRALFDPGVKEV